jgi:hypothetical protein
MFGRLHYILIAICGFGENGASAECRSAVLFNKCFATLPLTLNGPGSATIQNPRLISTPATIYGFSVIAIPSTFLVIAGEQSLDICSLEELMNLRKHRFRIETDFQL